MGLWKDFLDRLFKRTGDRTYIQVTECPDTEIHFAIEAFAVFNTVEMIASLLSKCEFKTYRNFQEFKGLEWHSLNVRPNKNQNATEFWQEFFCKLLYYQQVLVIEVGGQKIIADDFQVKEYALMDNTFTQVTRGDMTFNRTFYASEVFYVRYSNSNVRGLLSNVFNLYDQLITEASDKYIRSGGQKGTLEIEDAAQGAPDFEEKYKDLMENYFKSYFNAKNAVLPLWDGIKYTAEKSDNVRKSSNEISDIKNLVDEAISRAAQAYKIPPALFRGEVAGLKDVFDIMLTTCIDPLANMASEEMTGKEFTPQDVINGNYIDADTTRIKHIDIFDIANSVDKLISCGFANIDEVRTAAGWTAKNEDWSKKHYITKNYEDIENMKGGDENAQNVKKVQ